MSDGWRRLRLHDLCDSIDYGLTASATLDPVGPRFLRITDIVRGGIDWSSVPYVAVSGSDHAKYALRHGDIVVARTGATTGCSACILNPPESVFASYLVRFAIAREHHPRFVGYALRSPRWWEYIHGVLGDKSAQPNASARTLGEAWLDIPPLSEQRAIAEVLGALDEKIEANQRIARLCTSLESAVFLATDRLAVRVADVAEVVMGQSPPGSTYNQSGDGLPFYQGIRDFGFRSPGVRVWCSAPSRIAEPWDVLVSVRAPVGSLNVAAQRCAIGRGVASVRSRAHPNILYQALAANPGKWELFQGEGTVFGSIGGAQLRGVQIEWPVDTELERLSAILGALDSCLRAADSESQWLASLRDVLLPRFMSGELRARDTERAVQGAL